MVNGGGQSLHTRQTPLSAFMGLRQSTSPDTNHSSPRLSTRAAASSPSTAVSCHARTSWALSAAVRIYQWGGGKAGVNVPGST